MASFSAELHVAGESFPVTYCTFGVDQATHQRGQVSTQVRYGPVQLVLDVPDSEALAVWAASPQKKQLASVVFLDADGGQPVETLRLPGAYCVRYAEQFVSREVSGGSYQCALTLSDPTGWTIAAGGPARAFVAPAAGEHGVPGVSAGASGASGLGNLMLGGAMGMGAAVHQPPVDPADVPLHLPAPQPNPSPDYAQVHLTAAAWQLLIKDCWKDDAASKKQKFLFPATQRMTEIRVDGDPFTYRVGPDGRVIAVYDAQKQQSYNVTGTRKGYTRIPLTDPTAEPTYAGTNHMFPVTGDQKNVVQIQMTGNRKADFRAANDKAKLAGLVEGQGLANHRPPKGYIWHHRADFVVIGDGKTPPYGTCTMELVHEDAHKATIVHRGSCDQYNNHLVKLGKPKAYK